MMMIRNHCYWFSYIITIYFSLILHTIASPTSQFCRHDQRDALLEFRDEFLIDEPKADSWEKNNHIEWNKSSDCCVWKGVRCNDKSGQVVALDLSYTFLSGSLETNSSLFRLQYLRHLNLMNCDLHGVIPSSLGNLSHLTFLDLSFNNLVGEIPTSITNLSQLRSLSLRSNNLTGEIPTSIAKLNQLRSLSFENNDLIGNIPCSIGNFSHLVVLELGFNHLIGEIPVSIGKLNKLTTITLNHNSLSGNIHIQVLFANLTKLSYFSLYNNSLTSTLPSDMSGYHNLEYFIVGKNSFHGSFPKSLFLLPSLVMADLSGNQFMGDIEFANTSSSSKLRYLDLNRNKFSGPIPESISEFLKLDYFDLSHNNFSGPIPTSLSKLVNLTYLDLSNNMLEGKVPGCIQRLETVKLSHNSFSSFENSSVETLIRLLDISSNSFQEQFPLWTCNLKELNFLDMSNNLFSGSLPPCLRNLTDSIIELSLHNNNFSGTLPDLFANATELKFLDVSRNQLEGKFPKSLSNCKSLQLVNVEGNKIKDTFPSWLGSLPSLHVLILRSNDFFGPLYHSHGSTGFRSLRIIDISHNGFTGALPPHYFSNWREMTTLTNGMHQYMMDYVYYDIIGIYLSMEMVNKGVDMSFERIREDLRIIDFSGNKLYGKIPESVGLLKELRLLNLSGNAFIGNIPQSLANLTNLEELGLSCNKLTGKIPQDLGKLSFLSFMNFSHNLLQGFVPRGTQFQRQKCSSFSDNPGLYGLEEICGKNHFPNPTTQQVEEISETKEHMFNWIAAAIAYGPGVFCGLVIGYIFTSHYHEWFAEKFSQRKFTRAR